MNVAEFSLVTKHFAVQNTNEELTHALRRYVRRPMRGFNVKASFAYDMILFPKISHLVKQMATKMANLFWISTRRLPSQTHIVSFESMLTADHRPAGLTRSFARVCKLLRCTEVKQTGFLLQLRFGTALGNIFPAISN